MALCKLTRNWGDGQPVYVNPLQVISVDSNGEGSTWITTNATTEKGPHSIYVNETLDEVVRLLDASMPRMA